MRFPLVAAALALILVNTPISAQTVEFGKDRPGADFTYVDLPANGVAANCQGACLADSRCVASTLVRSAVTSALLPEERGAGGGRQRLLRVGRIECPALLDQSDRQQFGPDGDGIVSGRAWNDEPAQ